LFDQQHQSFAPLPTVVKYRYTVTLHVVLTVLSHPLIVEGLVFDTTPLELHSIKA